MVRKKQAFLLVDQHAWGGDLCLPHLPKGVEPRQGSRQGRRRHLQAARLRRQSVSVSENPYLHGLIYGGGSHSLNFVRAGVQFKSSHAGLSSHFQKNNFLILDHCYSVTKAEDPKMKSWHRDYDSAWVPPNADRSMVPSGLQARKFYCKKYKDQDNIN